MIYNTDDNLHEFLSGSFKNSSERRHMVLEYSYYDRFYYANADPDSVEVVKFPERLYYAAC